MIRRCVLLVLILASRCLLSLGPCNAQDAAMVASDYSANLSAVPSASSPAVTPPKYKSLRYDEDYGYLADQAVWPDFWDPVKYIPSSQVDGRYYSVGGEVRERYEFYHNPDFGRTPADASGNNDWLLQRYMLHADMHFSPQVRVFAQVFSGFSDGRIGGPRPDIDQDTFDAHQAFVDLNQEMMSGTLTWRVGRQEFEYGSGRLISAREVPNLRRSFDAVRLLWRYDEWAVDGFWSCPVRNKLNVFDDDPNPNKQLWGVYAVRPWQAIPDGHADLYYLGFENQEGTYFQGTEYELRHTLGTRIWGQPKPWEYNAELIWQFGTFGTGQIDAWAFASDTHYNYSDLPMQPRLGVRFDVTSGDRNPNSANLQTYNPMFPTGAYFTLADLGGPANFIHLHPTLDLQPREKLKATIDYGMYWRESLNDGLYSIGGFPIIPGQPSRARYNGSTLAATVTWEATRHLTVLTGYVHFFPGAFVEQNPPGKQVDYVTTWVTYKF